MSITWRDTTAMFAIVLGVAAIIAIAGGLPVAILDWRAAAMLLIILGAAMFAVLGPNLLPAEGIWATVSAVLHLLAIILSVLALIIGQKIAFLFLALTLVGLWSIATVNHLQGFNHRIARR
jgi:predicted permease